MHRNRKIAGAIVLAGLGLMAFAFVDAAEAEVASWYGEELRGSPTASGAPFNPDRLTAAHKTLPLGSKVWVSNGSRSVQVEINDRGPYVPGRDIDLSRAAAQTLGISGVGPVKIDAADVSDEIKQPEAQPMEKPSEGMTELPKTGGPGL
jgi:rare lipoprotein A